MKFYLSTLALTIILSISTLTALAMPAVPWPVEKKQPDGTTIQVYIRGDERVHWMESMDGYTLLYDKDRNVVYAEQDKQGDLMPSKTKCTGEAPVSVRATTKKDLRYSSDQVDALLQIWKVGESAKAPQKEAVKGNKKALCILVDFQNRSFVKTIEQFDMLMNQAGYSSGTAQGSVKDYYREVSYGQMDLTVTVIGIYTLPNTTAYYANNNKYMEFAETAIRMADDDVDFSEYANADGELETVHIIYAGYADNVIGNGQQIWPHKWQVYPSFTLDETEISVYSCSSELRGASGSTICGIGTICHELCHVFGAPDYYDTDYSESGGQYIFTNYWDLMGSGGHNGNGDLPAHINMYQKILFEWVEPTYLTEKTSVKNMPNAAKNPVAYVIEVNEDEYYILENRQSEGFDRGLYASGMIVYHTHPDLLDPYRWWGNSINTTHPQLLYVVDANCSTAIPTANPSSYGTLDYPFAHPFGIYGNDELSGLSTPAMFTWADMSPVYDKPLTNIKSSNKLVSFDFMAEEINCLPVRDLQVETGESKVILTWAPPVNSEGDYTYTVYLGETAVVSALEECQYTLENLEAGTISLCVEAVKEDCQSPSVCKNATIPSLKALSFFPEDGAIDVPVNTTINVFFNENIRVANVSGSSIYTDNNSLSGIQTGAINNKLIVNHAELEPETTYTVVVSSGTVRQYTSNLTWSFTTASATSIEKTSIDAEVFPTVSNGLIHIKTAENAIVKVVSLSGSLLQTASINGSDTLSLDYPNGVYLLMIESPSGKSYHKILLNR